MKKSITKKIRSLRFKVVSYSLAPLESSLRGLKHYVESSNLSLNNLCYDIACHSNEVASIQESIRDSFLEFYSESKARLTTIERCLYVIFFALIVALFLLVVLMFI